MSVGLTGIHFYVILSHLHPDHLSGAAFPNAHFFVTQEVYEVYQKPKLKI